MLFWLIVTVSSAFWLAGSVICYLNGRRTTPVISGVVGTASLIVIFAWPQWEFVFMVLLAGLAFSLWFMNRLENV